MNTRSIGFYVGHGPQSCMERADQHNEIELNFVERGSLVLQHGPNTVTVAAGSTVLYWAAIPHQVVAVDPHTEIAWLVLPLAWFLSWNLAPTFSGPLLHGQILNIPPASEGVVCSPPLRRWAEDFASSLPELQKAIELELEAFFRRLATGVLGKTGSTRGSKGGGFHLDKNQSTRVQQMVRFMTEHSAESITVSQIAGAAGLNAEYAMRLFRKSWGMTLWDFLLQQRICQAQRLLVLSDAKIVDIAFQCGFGSASRFYSAFAKQCRCSPLAFRRKCSRE
ncbi:MAG: helix-turn-helix domain-containing protein [Chthoniobacteraceae bacterium]